MDFLEIAEAIFKLGLPMSVISWFMFTWLHKEGRINITADRKTIEEELKDIKKNRASVKSERAKKRKEQKSSLAEKFNSFKQSFAQNVNSTADEKIADNTNYVFDRWMWFGSGFYGLAALWTFVVIETIDIFTFIFTFPGFAKLFENGIFALITSLIVNQIGNIVSAFIWFKYWTDDSIGWWFLIAYLGYMAGMKVAKFQNA